MILTCRNCGHEVKRNYYGGYIHANQFLNYCDIQTTKDTPCGCTIPIG